MQINVAPRDVHMDGNSLKANMKITKENYMGT